MKAYEFRFVEKITIAGKRRDLKEYVHGDWFLFGKTKIRAKTKAEAISKLKARFETAH